jgi:hypothetical protein
MIVSSVDNSGNFSGTGHSNSDLGTTWILEGKISGKTINFEITYTGKNRGYTTKSIGALTSNGSMSGTAISSTGQKFSWKN